MSGLCGCIGARLSHDEGEALRVMEGSETDANDLELKRRADAIATQNSSESDARARNMLSGGCASLGKRRTRPSRKLIQAEVVWPVRRIPRS